MTGGVLFPVLIFMLATYQFISIFITKKKGTVTIFPKRVPQIRVLFQF
jgi:hypothetical protein